MSSETKDHAVEDMDKIRDLYEELLQEVIREDSRKANLSVKVKDVQDFVPAGNNNLSCIHRVFLEISSVDVPPEERIIVLKLFPKSEMLQNILTEAGIFEFEKAMYKKVLPEMNKKCIDKLGCSTFSAKSFNTNKNNLIILEDLNLAGYKMPDRLLGLDLDHCILALKALARFHAVSVALIDANPSFLDLLPENKFVKNIPREYLQVMVNEFKELSEIVESWPDFERFGNKLRNVSEILPESIWQFRDPSKTKMAVLNHGDYWLTNLLFKYSDTGEVQDVKLVDFQMTNFATPAIDLHLFFITCPNNDVRYGGSEKLLVVYHSEFCRVLETLGCEHKIMSIDDLKEEMKSTGLLALNYACLRLTNVFAERDNVPDVSEKTADTFESKNRFHKIYSCTKRRQELQRLLLIFEEDGVL